MNTSATSASLAQHLSSLSDVEQQILEQPDHFARNKVQSARKRPSIIAVCWMQAMLW